MESYLEHGYHVAQLSALSMCLACSFRPLPEGCRKCTLPAAGVSNCFAST